MLAFLSRLLGKTNETRVGDSGSAGSNSFDQNQEDLGRNEAMYRAIFENTGSASILIASDTTILLANTEWYKLSGYSQEDVQNKISWTVFVVEDDLEMMLRYHRARRAENQSAPNDYEFRMQTKGGQLKHIVLRVAMIPGTDISIASMHDVTDRKIAEEKFRLAFHSAPTPMTLGEAGVGPYVEVNDAAVAFCGYSREEIIGRSWAELEFIPRNEQQELLTSIKQNNRVRDMEITFRVKGGNVKKTILNADIVEINGKPHVLTAVIDITERKAIEQALKDSEEKFRLFAENALDGFVIIRNNRYVYLNPAICDMLGYTEEDLLGMVDIGAIGADTPIGKSRITQNYRKRLKGEIGDEPYESQLIHKDGKTIIDVLLSPASVAFQGEPHVFVLIKNITARKNAEAQHEVFMIALRESEEKYRSLLRYSSDPIFALDRDGSYLYVNEAFARPFGKEPEDIIGRNMRFLFNEEESAQRFMAIQEVFDSGQAQEIEVTVKSADGSLLWFVTAIDPIRDIEGRVVSVSCISRDITRRKSVEDALKLSEEKYRSLFMYTPAGVVNFDLNMIVTDCNDRFTDILESSRSRIIGLDMHKLKEQVVLTALNKALRGQEGFYEGLYRATTSDAEKWIFMHTAPLFASDGSLTGGIAIVEDTSPRREAEIERDRLRYLLENIFDSMPSILVGIDGQRKITQWNQEARIRTGLNEFEVLGRDIEDVLPAARLIQKQIDLALEEKCIQREDRMADTENGEQRFMEAVIYPLSSNGISGAVIRMDDITEKVRLEEMMIQTEKMMSVGGMAAGMAHEINNPLGGILQGAQNVLRRLETDNLQNRQIAEANGTSIESIRGYAEQRQIITFIEGIRSSGMRASNIVSNMLQFSRGSSLKKEYASLSTLLERTIELAGSDYDLNKNYDFRHIEIVRDYDQNLPDVMCSPVEIEQVILNLLKNAAQEMNARDRKPKISMHTMQDGDWAVIEVADNGPGMPENVRRRVFEPFYTTKPTGAGTGLGLAVSYFIVTNNHKGQIFVESAPGEGAVFTIRLPLDSQAERLGNAEYQNW